MSDFQIKYLFDLDEKPFKILSGANPRFLSISNID